MTALFTLKKNRISNESIICRMDELRSHGFFASVSGLCHPGVSFWFEIYFIIFCYEKSEFNKATFKHNDSNLITLLC